MMKCVMAGTVRSVERLAVLVTFFKAAVDASTSSSSSSSSSSTELLRLASSPGFSLAGSLLTITLKTAMHSLLCAYQASLHTTTDFPSLWLTAVTVALSGGFCIFARCFLDAVQPSKSITLALWR